MTGVPAHGRDHGHELVRRALAAEGGALGDRRLWSQAADRPESPGPAQWAAAGPRAAGRAEEVELAVAAVHEGHQQHYVGPGALAIDEPDLALLAGDRLYALGLDRLARLGDLDAICELADVIALAAQAHASADPALAAAAWDHGAIAVGWGPSAAGEAAKAAARAGDRAAGDALRAAARALAPPSV